MAGGVANQRLPLPRLATEHADRIPGPGNCRRATNPQAGIRWIYWQASRLVLGRLWTTLVWHGSTRITSKAA
jgi:hypothetical protein